MISCTLCGEECCKLTMAPRAIAEAVLTSGAGSSNVCLRPGITSGR